MNKKTERRSFLGKLALGAAAIIARPVAGISKSVLDEYEKSNGLGKEESVKSIRAMGFQWETADPFLFCVHHEDKFPKGNAQMGPAESYLEGRHMGDDFIIKDGFRMYHGRTVPGFPGHPHRGFETITVVREGIVDHADSMGASGRYGNGDVQWMTAGKGVQHSEMFPLIYEDKENPMELFQIWLNLPKRNKMVEPHFKMLWADAIPKYHHKDRNTKHTIVEVMAGKLGKYKAPAPPPDSWANDPANEVAVYNIQMEAGAQFTLPKASAGINRNLYFYLGEEILVNGAKAGSYHAIEVNPGHDLVIENGKKEARILVLQGKPIGEPVMQYGPFVMNTKEEIHQAFDDYHATQFGGWPWPNSAQVHARNKGRFAKHADGTLESKSI